MENISRFNDLKASLQNAGYQHDIRNITYIIDQVEAGTVFVHADESVWTRRCRQLSGQAKFSTENLIEHVAKRGAIAFITSQQVEDSPIPTYLVEDTRRTLWHLSEEIRKDFSGRVVGVTGTSGKSTVTSLVQYLAGSQISTGGIVGNWNTTDGTASAVTTLLQKPAVGVFETSIGALMRFPDFSSSRFVRPDIAVLTSIGTAHLDLAPSHYDTALYKSKIFEHLSHQGTAVINGDTHYSNLLKEQALQAGAQRVVMVGESADFDCRLVSWVPNTEGALIQAQILGDRFEIKINNPSYALALSTLIALAVIGELGLSIPDAIERLKTYSYGRRVCEISRVKLADGYVTLVDDTKNATDISYYAAIDAATSLAEQTEGRVLVAAGHILYLGEQAEETHRNVGKYMRLARVSRVYTHGPDMEPLREEVGRRARLPHAESPKQLARQVARNAREGDVVLIKGSHRGTGMREVAPELRRAIRRRNRRMEERARDSAKTRQQDGLKQKVLRVFKRS